MRNKTGSVRTAAILLVSILAISGCGIKQKESLGDKFENNIDKITSETDAEAQTAETGQNADEAENEDALKDENVQNSEDAENSPFDEVLGTYVYMDGDELEERVFQISSFAGNYFIEYSGNYDYAGAEIAVLDEGTETADNELMFGAVLYPFSGFSFMGEYWGSGYECNIVLCEDGDVKIYGDKNEPFFGGDGMLLEKTNAAEIHISAADATTADDCDEILGTWKTVSERDGEKHLIVLEFSPDGGFRAIDKVEEYPVRMYIGRFEAKHTDGELTGQIFSEAFAYGGMPYEWELRYDDKQKCPVIYEDYSYAEPFTFKEEDKNLPFERYDFNGEMLFVPGPGSRAGEVEEMHKEYCGVSENDDYGDCVNENNLLGVWQYCTDTPGGDPCVFQLEISKDHVSYSEFTMTGYVWFENYCYDGTVELSDTYDDGSTIAEFMMSQLDESGTETDSFFGNYNLQYSDSDQNFLQIMYISGDYLVYDDSSDVVQHVFTRVEEPIFAGDPVLDN